MDDGLEQSMNAFSNLDPGPHRLKVVDDENCIDEMEFFIEDFEPIEVEYDFENPTCGQANGSVMLEARGGAGPLTIVYDEIVYAADELIEGLYKGSHTFMIVDTTNCVKSVTVELDVSCNYYIPNMFSPDSDGINDTFEIFFNSSSAPIIKEFSIYDRWGGLVVQMLNVDSSIESISWDGTFNNQDAVPGVYTYILSGEFETGEEIESQGTITLVK